jgi:general secretion pathway protein M
MGLKEQLTNLSPREQRLLAILGGVFALMIFLGLPIYVYTGLSEARERNDEIREVMRRMNRASELLAKRKSERLALDLRYAKPAPALASFIEKAASANGLEVPESTDQSPRPIDGGYTERATTVKLRKVNLKPLVKMLERIERSGHPVSISALSIKAKASGPDLYDVTLAVSAFDKEGNETASEAAEKSSDSATKRRGR